MDGQINGNGISDIFFDLDHTLWDFDRNSRLAFMRLFEYYSITIDLEAFMRTYEPINFRYWKLYRDGVITKADLRKRRFRDVFEHFDMALSEEVAIEMEAHYISELPGSNHLFDGAKEVLTKLSRHYGLHIITNGFEEVQGIKLRNSGIHHFFKSVTTSEEAGKSKPHPDIFRLALSKAGIAPEQGIMIGDTYEADIVGAHNIGMRVIYFNYRREDIPAQFQKVDALQDVLKLL